jgi:hypothetical protein
LTGGTIRKEVPQSQAAVSFDLEKIQKQIESGVGG